MSDVLPEPDYTIPVSSRLTRLPPYLFGRINATKLRKRREGVDIIDLGMGNPNDPTPEPIVEKLCEAARDQRNQRCRDGGQHQQDQCEAPAHD